MQVPPSVLFLNVLSDRYSGLSLIFFGQLAPLPIPGRCSEPGMPLSIRSTRCKRCRP
jgi:hypothetical protein